MPIINFKNYFFRPENKWKNLLKRINHSCGFCLNKVFYINSTNLAFFHTYFYSSVRPGMDLSKVVLPTFILEPRSFLDKLSDSFYHVDIISQAVLENDPFTVAIYSDFIERDI